MVLPVGFFLHTQHHSSCASGTVLSRKIQVAWSTTFDLKASIKIKTKEWPGRQ